MFLFMFQKIIEKLLKSWAKAVLKKQRPWIVTVTGSMGKTSAKEAIYAVLKDRFRVRRNIKNYNNELGVPLTIIGSESGAKNIFLWKWIFMKALILSLFKDKKYPEILVLEIAADKPGDLKYLMEMFPRELLKAAVLTAVAPVHLEFFGTLENILKEKTTPFSYLPEQAFAIYNRDNCPDPGGGISRGRAISYSLDQAGDFLKQFIFPHQAYAPLAGIAVGRVFGISQQEAKDSLAKNYQLLPGRGRKIAGINQSILIDDTYNSSPLSARRALEALKDFPIQGGRRIAVLGDMLELGEKSPDFHREIGELAKALGIDYLITFGKEAKFIYNGARESGFAAGYLFYFSEAKREKLISFLKQILRPNDVILIKGSQGVRMEKVVKALMEEPERAKELLVRQNRSWLKR